MTNEAKRWSATARSWGIPIVLTALGAYGWACVDDPDLSGSESTGGDASAQTSASGSGPGTSPTTMTSEGTTSEGTTSDDPTTSPGTGDPSVTPADVLESIA